MSGAEIRRRLGAAITSLIQVANDPENVPGVLLALGTLRDLDARLEREAVGNAPDSGERFYRCLTMGEEFLYVVAPDYPSLDAAVEGTSRPYGRSSTRTAHTLGVCASRRRLGFNELVDASNDPDVRIIMRSRRIKS